MTSIVCALQLLLVILILRRPEWAVGGLSDRHRRAPGRVLMSRVSWIRVGYADVADEQQRIAPQGLEQGARRVSSTARGVRDSERLINRRCDWLGAAHR